MVAWTLCKLRSLSQDGVVRLSPLRLGRERKIGLAKVSGEARTLELRSTPAGAFALRMFAEERRRVVITSGKEGKISSAGQPAIAASAWPSAG